jgi:hypothetical protein
MKERWWTAFIGGAVLLQLMIYGAVIAIVIHFVRKFW